MTRRGNNEGNIRKRTDGRWEARITIGITPTGKPRSRSIYGKTRKEVNDQLGTLLNKAKHGGLTEEDRTSTLEQYLIRWLELHDNLSDAGRQHYQDCITYYIKPHIGGVRLVHLTTLMVETFYAALRRNGKGARVVQACHTCLKAALNKATRWKLLTSNPMLDVTRPAKPETVRTVWTESQAQKFLMTASTLEPRWYPLFATFLLTGVRRGEAFGLRWQDVNLEIPKPRMRIEQTVQIIAGKYSIKPSPKTSAGRRSFTIPNGLAEILRVRSADQILEREKAGLTWQPIANGLDLIFTNRRGQPVEKNTVKLALHRVCNAAEIPIVTLHEIRHTYVTHAIKRKVPIKEVSRRVGHASTSITLEIYQHLDLEMDEDAALDIADLYAIKKDPKEPEST